ncbi:GcrA family cell cycle regulator [Brucella anthropi]|uniref:GcrA family cell cycle regulator n=1 Tax=Brucella anthropi TaxID=529 RepID=UPI00125D29B7|nr:GcrA family cell cycle regulator [Brucella anthropi]QFP61869.1 hypothetical protein FT787_01465 [Brucella anthropi]
MTSESEEFFLVGVVHPISDGPCLCTPLFRSVTGKKYYIQDSIDGYTISGFSLIEYDFGDNFSYLQANKSFQSGGPIQYGLKWTDENPLVFDLEHLHSYFRNNYTRFAEYDYFFFQMAFLTNDAYAINKTINNKRIKHAIRTRILKLALNIRKSGRIENLPWSDTEVNILRMLWSFRFSASEIGLSLGRSRNAVISMATRLRIRRPRIHKLSGRATLRFVSDERIE